MIGSKPYIVLDWGWIRARTNPHLSNRANYLIPQSLFAEVVNSSNPPSFARKLHKFINANADKLFLGRTWFDMAALEVDPDRPCSMTDAIHYRQSAEMVLIAREQTPDKYVAGLITVAGSRADRLHEEGRTDFVDGCRYFAEWFVQEVPNWKASLATTEARQSWIRHPDHVARFVGLHHPRMNTGVWQSALRCFPDRYVAARWARIQVWYSLTMSLDETREFGNNWDDAHYAILAAYTGHLWTHDRGLTALVKAVFPDVKVSPGPV